ncbi:MAG: sulfatase [Verrucomicrobiaceae bacterium]|nr:MAG: sulfatase [Verrucomicrobiaceae bacterium]
MKPTIPFFAALLLAPLAALLAAEKKNDKPNIIVIYTDDHGYADLGCMGLMADVKTPNIDKLASGGVLMTSGYVTAPQCSPSRCGVIGGQYQGKYGMDHNGMLEDDPALLERFRALNNLPKRMKSAGYVTGMAGKSHLGSDNSAELVKLGFDKAFFKHSAGPGNWNMDLAGKDIEPQVQQGDAYHLEMIADFACTFINRFKNQPFFFYLAFRGPHVPLDAPQKYLDRFPGEMPEERRKALGAISCIDDGIGKIMETLRKNGLEENTLIFLIADNGAPLKMMPHEFVTDSSGLKTLKPGTPSGWNSWDGSLNDPMNGEKGMLTEGGIRVPFIVHWTGKIPGGQVYAKPVISLDVAATANALAGLPNDPALDGTNLMPYLTGKDSGAPHDTLYWRWGGQFAIRQGDWKLIVAGKQQYLFNLATDPEEHHDQIAQHPEIVQALRPKLEQWSQTLIPAGLDCLSSSQQASDFFAHYLDGKPAPTTSPKDPANRKAKGQAKSSAETKTTDGSNGDREKLLKLFDLRDKDKDGRVTLEDFINGRTGPTVPKLTQHFKELDRNGDGVWTQDELESSSKSKKVSE